MTHVLIHIISYIRRCLQAGQNPDTATAEMAAAGEVACPGGEEAFVRAIIRDSLQLRYMLARHRTTQFFSINCAEDAKHKEENKTRHEWQGWNLTGRLMELELREMQALQVFKALPLVLPLKPLSTSGW